MGRPKSEGSPEKIKVLIVDDHFVVVRGIQQALERLHDIQVAGTASDGDKAIEMVKNLNPHIVIMDISMPGMNGLDATRAIKNLNAEISIVIFTMYNEKEYILSLFKAGINGLVFKDEPLEDLIMAIKSVRDGGTYYSKAVQVVLREYINELESGVKAEAVEPEDPFSMLSRREMEVFSLLADGRKIKDIADRLFISPKTVETHKYNIMDKLGSSSSTELTKLAIKKGLIEL